MPVLKPLPPPQRMFWTRPLGLYINFSIHSPVVSPLELILYLSEDSFKTTAETQGPLN